MKFINLSCRTTLGLAVRDMDGSTNEDVERGLPRQEVSGEWRRKAAQPLEQRQATGKMRAWNGTDSLPE